MLLSKQLPVQPATSILCLEAERDASAVDLAEDEDGATMGTRDRRARETSADTIWTRVLRKHVLLSIMFLGASVSRKKVRD